MAALIPLGSMAGIRRAKDYWGGAFKAAVDYKELVASKIAFVLGLVLLVARAYTEIPVADKLLTVGEYVSFGISVLYVLLWYPVEKDNERQTRIGELEEAKMPLLSMSGGGKMTHPFRFESMIEVRNDRGQRSAEVIRLQLLNAENYNGAYSDATLPTQLSFLTELNPGEGAGSYFLQVDLKDEPGPHGPVHLEGRILSPARPGGSLLFHQNKDYKFTFLVTAHDFPETKVSFNLRFEFKDVSMWKVSMTRI